VRDAGQHRVDKVELLQSTAQARLTVLHTGKVDVMTAMVTANPPAQRSRR
jgi:hypothetical protein